VLRLTFAAALCSICLAGCGGQAIPATDAGSGTPYPKPDYASSSLQQGLDRLNLYRRAAGIGVAAMDGATSEACLGHLQYLATEAAGAGTCLLQHDEPDTANPYYSPTNEQAGMGALIACVPPASGELSVARAVDRWIGSLYHRIPLLSPALGAVGIAEQGGYVCLNYQQGTGAMSEVQLVTWPAPGMIDVPEGFPGRESPCPTVPSNPQGTPAEQCPTSGFIVTATWYGPPGSGTFSSLLSASVATAAGMPFGAVAVYADGIAGNDPVPGGAPRTIAFLPATLLPAQTMVRATLQGVIDGVQRDAVWEFTTGTRQE
jgi:hypothetical protein